MGRSLLTICHIIEDFQKKRTGVDGKNEKKNKKNLLKPLLQFLENQPYYESQGRENQQGSWTFLNHKKTVFSTQDAEKHRFFN